MTSGNTPAQSVAAPLVLAFADFAIRQGVDQTVIENVLGRKGSLKEDQQNVYSLTVFRNLLAVAKHHLKRSDIALLFAAQADYSEIALSGLIANASATMAEALDALNKYARLTIDTPFKGNSPLEFRQNEDADWIIDQRLLDQPLPELIEISFTFLITGPMAFLPRHHIEQVFLAYPEPDHSDAYRQIWRTRITFNAKQNALRLPKWVAKHPVQLQPEYARNILAAHADLEMQREKKFATFADELRHLMIPALKTGDVSIHWVAGQLGVSRQTIYRRLKKENQTFEGVLDSLRRRVALDQLAEQSRTVSEIAFELGFADASSFSRAFRRWTGMFPTAYRAQHLNGPFCADDKSEE